VDPPQLQSGGRCSERRCKCPVADDVDDWLAGWLDHRGNTSRRRPVKLTGTLLGAERRQTDDRGGVMAWSECTDTADYENLYFTRMNIPGSKTDGKL